MIGTVAGISRWRIVSPGHAPTVLRVGCLVSSHLKRRYFVHRWAECNKLENILFSLDLNVGLQKPETN